MNTTTQQHNSIHIPKYETEPVRFNTPTDNTSVDIADIQNFIREKAEKNLERCKYFDISLPSSITGITDESNQIKFKSLFQTPTLNDLEIVSTNRDGSSIKLNNHQLQSVKQTGEFEVNSLHFPGQNHRWKLNKLLQSGIQTANEVFFKELSWVVYMLIIFTRDRIQSNNFSFKSTIKSWKRGFINLLDKLIGLPAITSKIMELIPNENEKEMHKNFCEQIPVLLEMVSNYNLPEMVPYAHHFLAPDKIAIDLQLYNPNLQNEIGNIIYDLLSNNTQKNWFNTTKRRLINEYKHRQIELGLSKDEIANCIQTDLNNEYTTRIFEIIENSDELEHLSPGLGQLLVEQARAVLTMKSVGEKFNENLEKHLKLIREKLVHDHPIKSKITRWINEKNLNERIKYIHEHQWDTHQLSIDQCRTLGNHQAAYFFQRDLIFRRDHEANLRQNLKSPIEPRRTIYSRRSIWFSSNWIVERTHPLPVKQIPTYFSDKKYSPDEEERRIALIKSDRDARYQLRKDTTYSITTEYPFWRWKLFAIRIYCWLSNAIFALCLVIPFASLVSFRALFSTKSYTTNYYLQQDLKLYGSFESTIHTFISRIVALWNNIRKSRQKFEQTPDRGVFLGKNIQRIFNRFWNYIGKGFVGTVAICAVYPILCSSLSILSFILGILLPIWMPILIVVYHIGEILIYDADSVGKYSRKLFCLINIVIADFLGFGIIQPIFVLISLLISPVISLLISIYALLHRCTQGLYDTIIYHLIIKHFARIPAHNSFLARRIAGPGLASQYFYQVSSIEVLAALESLIEQNQLKIYRGYVERILRKPIKEYQQFFNLVFQPFAGRIQTDINSTVYEQMNKFVHEKLRQLQETIQKRNNLLQLHRGDKHNRIRLTETDLTAVLIEGTQLVEKWYQIKFYQLFCREILTPLEQTDTFYSLKIDHLTLTKYAQMINSANLHDDLDVVTSVYMSETSYATQQPIFDRQIFNPIEYRLDKSTIYSISIKLTELICINIIIYKYNNDNFITTSLKNISFQKIVQLIKYNQQFYQEHIVPLPLSTISNNLLLNKKFL